LFGNFLFQIAAKHRQEVLKNNFVEATAAGLKGFQTIFHEPERNSHNKVFLNLVGEKT